MFETIGENSFLKVQDLKYKGDQVYTNRNSIADEFAAIANTANGVLRFYENIHQSPILFRNLGN